MNKIEEAIKKLQQNQLNATGLQYVNANRSPKSNGEDQVKEQSVSDTTTHSVPTSHSVSKPSIALDSKNPIICKFMTQYIHCKNMNTGEMWIENHRSFPTSDSDIKKMGFYGKKTTKKKATIIKKKKDEKEQETVQENY